MYVCIIHVSFPIAADTSKKRQPYPKTWPRRGRLMRLRTGSPIQKQAETMATGEAKSRQPCPKTGKVRAERPETPAANGAKDWQLYQKTAAGAGQ